MRNGMMVKYNVLGDGKYNFILQNKLGSTTLRNYIGDLKESEIEFYNNDLPIIVPFRSPWGRFLSGQIQDFMDLIVEDNDIYAIGADDSKIHILSINKKESKYFKLFLEKLHEGSYVNEVKVNDITDVGFSICSQMFNESSNHEWWFDGHTWPNDLLVRQYNEAKRTGKIRFVLLRDLSEVIKVLFGREIPPSDVRLRRLRGRQRYIIDHMNTKKYIRLQLLNINKTYGNKIKGGFLFADNVNEMSLKPSEKIIFREIIRLEEYYYEKIIEDGVKWWENDYGREGTSDA